MPFDLTPLSHIEHGYLVGLGFKLTSPDVKRRRLKNDRWLDGLIFERANFLKWSFWFIEFWAWRYDKESRLKNSLSIGSKDPFFHTEFSEKPMMWIPITRNDKIAFGVKRENLEFLLLFFKIFKSIIFCPVGITILCLFLDRIWPIVKISIFKKGKSKQKIFGKVCEAFVSL